MHCIHYCHIHFQRPIRRGVVSDWEDWSLLVENVLSMEMNLDLEDISVALLESAFSTRKARESAAEVSGFVRTRLKTFLINSFHLYLVLSSPHYPTLGCSKI